MDFINIQLDAGNVTKGADEALRTLQKIRALVQATEPISARLTRGVDADVAQQLRALESLTTRARHAAFSVKTALRAGGVEAAKSLGSPVLSAIDEVRQALQRLQAMKLKRPDTRLMRESFDSLRLQLEELERAAVKLTPLVGQQMNVIAAAARQTAVEVATSANKIEAAQRRTKPTSKDSKGAEVAAVIGAPVENVSKGADKSANALQRLRAAMLGATTDSENLHSALRGLASGFGAIWLTWGRIAPLLAGAALSNAAVNMTKAGAEFDHTFKQIGSLGELAAGDVAKLREEALKLSQDSTYGPVELAKAMKTLTLAGLQTKETLQSLPAVLDFAKVGEVSLDRASQVLVAVGTAYGYTADQFEYVGDVIAKTAALTMVDVDDMAESFKQASTIAQQYGVSLEDTATALGLLGQLNIRGSAAGTSFRQMYNELIGSSKKAKKVLRETLNVSILDEFERKAKPLPVIMKELMAALSGRSYREVMDILQTISTERGFKSLSALLQSLATQAKEAGTNFETEFQRIYEAVRMSAGFTANAAREIDTSMQSLMKKVGATIENTLLKGFEHAQPALTRFFEVLREALSTPEFASALGALTSLLAQLATGFIQVTATLGRVLAVTGAVVAAVGSAIAVMHLWVRATAAVVAAKAVLGGGIAGLVAVLSSAVTKVSAFAKSLFTVNTAAAASAGATATAATGFRALFAALRPLVLGLTAVTVAWEIFQAVSSKNPAEGAVKDVNDAIEQTKARADELRKKIAEIQGGGSVESAEALTERDKLRKQWDVEKGMDATQKRLQALQKLQNQFRANEKDQSRAIGASVSRANQELDQKVREREHTFGRLKAAQEDLVKLQRQYGDLMQSQVAARASTITSKVSMPGIDDAADKAEKASKSSARATKKLSEQDKVVKSLTDKVAEFNAKLEEKHALLLQNAGAVDKVTESQTLLYRLEKALSDPSLNAAQRQQLEEAKQATLAAAEREKAVIALEKEQEAYRKKVEGHRNAADKYKEEIEATKLAIETHGKSKRAIEELTVARLEASLAEAKSKGNQQALVEALQQEIEQRKALLELTPELERLNVLKTIREEGELLKEQHRLRMSEPDLTHLSDLERAKIVAKRKVELEYAKKIAEIEKNDNLTDAGRDEATAALRANQVLAEQRAVQEVVEEEWKKTTDQINQSLTDALMRGFESGKGFARNLRDTLKNLFGTLVLRPLIQPIVGGIGGFLATGLGSASAAQGGAGGGLGQMGLLGRVGSMLRNRFGNGSMLGNAWNMFNNGWTLFSRGGYSALSSNLSALWSNGAYGHALSTGAGALAGGLGAFMGGRALGRALSGGYAAWGSGNGASNLGAALGLLSRSLGPLLGSLLGGALGGVFNRLFGRKLTGHGIEGEFGGDEGFTGRQWRHYKGGPFRSSKTEYRELDADVRTALAKPFKLMRDQLRTAAELLNIPTDVIDKFRHTIRLNLNGLKPEEIAAQYDRVFGEAREALARAILDEAGKAFALDWDSADFHLKADQAGQAVASAIAESASSSGATQRVRHFFERDGETAVQTLERLAGALSVTNHAFSLLGLTLYEANIRGAHLASQLVDLFGEADDDQAARREAFNSQTNSYFQNYYTEEERRARIMHTVAEQFRNMGLALPSTRAEFRALVESLDLSTDAGRRMFARLMGLSAAFAEATEGAEDASKAAEKLAEKLKEALKAAEDATDAALKGLEAAIDRQVDALKKSLESVKSLAAEAKEIRDLAWGGSRELYSASPAVSSNLTAQGKQFIAESLLGIRHGLMPDASKLRDAISAAKGGLVEGNYASFVEFERERLVLAGRLQEIGDRADGQLSVAEQQVKHLETQIDQLNQQKEYWREQVALMRGQITHVSSIDEGVSKLVAAMEAERRARDAVDAANKKPGAGAGGATFGGSAPAGGAVNGRAAADAALQQIGKDGGKAQVYNTPVGWHVRRITDEAELDAANKLARSIVNAHGDRKAFTDAVAGKSVLEIAGAMGYMADDTQRFLESQGYKIQGGRVVPAYAKGGYHGGGWALVGEQGPELVNFEQPARIYNHADTRAALSGGDSDAAREVAALRREVAELRAVLASIADSTRRSADTLRNVTPDGDAIRVETV